MRPVRGGLGTTRPTKLGFRCLKPIQQDAGGGVQLELVALLESAPTVGVGFGDGIVTGKQIGRAHVSTPVT